MPIGGRRAEDIYRWKAAVLGKTVGRGKDMEILVIAITVSFMAVIGIATTVL